MFTGIVQGVGHGPVASSRTAATCALRSTPGELSLAGIEIGDSIAVNGGCLTAAQLEPHAFAADVSRETLSLHDARRTGRRGRRSTWRRR